MNRFNDVTKSLLINFPKSNITMLKSKNIKLKTVNSIKNKLNTSKPINKKQILNKKTEFHRTLEAFSDCV